MTKATISRSYLLRIGLIALACLGWGAYCIYDGFVAYPAQTEVYLEFKKTQTDNPTGWQEEWETKAKENGWPLKQGKIKDRRGFDTYAQYVMAAITLPIGCVFGLGYLRNAGRWVAADESGLTTNSGKTAAWEDIQDVDTTRWKTKGIAYVIFRKPSDSEGQTDRILLDDWKFDREPTRKIMQQIEQHLGLNEV